MPHCWVKRCKMSDRNRPNGVTFHQFPKKTAKEWLRAIRRDENTLVNQQRICSLHFEKKDFEIYGAVTRLKSGSIPTKNLPLKSATQISVTCPLVVTTENVQTPLLTEKWVAHEHQFTPPEQCSMDVFNNGAGASQASDPLFIPPDTESEGTLERTPAKNVRFDCSLETGLLCEEIISSPETSSVSSPLKMKNLISAFHSYSRSSDNFEEQIQKANARAEFYRKKLKYVLLTSVRRKKKIIHLTQIINDLKKQLKTRK